MDHNSQVVRGDTTNNNEAYNARNEGQTRARYNKPKGPPLPRKTGEIGLLMKNMNANFAPPPRSVTCNKCKNKGHYQVVCQSKSKPVHDVKSMGENQVLFLREVNGESNNSWTAQTGINGHNTKFKLGTGLSVCVISGSVPWLKDITLNNH